MIQRFILTAILSLLTTQAFSYTSKSFNGKMTNLTGFKTSQVEIKFGLYCNYVIIVDGYNCGEKEVVIAPNEDGSFTIPSLTLNPGIFKEKYIQTSFSILVNGKSIQNTFAKSDEANCRTKDCLFDKARKSLTAFTLVKVPDLILNPVFTSNIDPREFYRGNSKPYLAFYLGVQYKNYAKTSLSPEIIASLQDENIFKMVMPVLFVPEKLEPSDSIAFTISDGTSKCAKSDKKYVFNYSPKTSLEVVNVYLNDLDEETKQSCIYSANLLEGKREVTFQVRKSSEAGYCQYQADLKCEAGILNGEMKLLKTSSCPDQVPSQKVIGTCGKESSEVEFSLNGELLFSKLKRTWEYSKSWHGDVFNKETSQVVGFLSL